MNRLHTSRLQRFLRTTALLLALICLGVSGGTTLVHTDDVGSLLQFHAGVSTVTHGVVTAPDFCLACEWENTIFSPQVPAVPIIHPVLTLLPALCAGIQAHFPDPFDHTSSRAPPRL